MLNNLPVIVTAPGIYITRNGARVMVHNIKPAPSPDVTAFTVQGSVERMFRGKPRFKGYEIWHISGRAYSHKESGRDIVAKA